MTLVTISILALLCAAILAFVLHPVMVDGKARRHGWVAMAGLAVGAMMLYLAFGSPGMPGAMAAFETSGPRHDGRIAAQRELILIEALSGAPEHVSLLLELGTLRIQNGKPQDALEPLMQANRITPGNESIHEAIGAGHYALALQYAAQPRKDARIMALRHFESALEWTPKESEFLPRLREDEKNYRAMNPQ